MGLPRFFDRVFAAAGRQLSVSRDSLSAALQGTTVAVECHDDHPNSVWVTELLCNLCARLYPRLRLDIGSVKQRDKLSDLITSINPKCDIVESAPSIRVRIGPQSIAAGEAIYARADGWVASVGVTPFEETLAGPPNPFTAAATAAFAAAALFRHVFAKQLSATNDDDTVVSLLDYSRTTGRDLPLQQVRLPTTGFLGLGAVGNAGVWALSRCAELSGTIYLVDHETVELSNLQRYVLTTDSDVRKAKTVIAHRAFAESRIDARKVSSTIEKCDASGAHIGLGDAGHNGVPVLCVSVDNVSGRRHAQALLPELLINGWTSDSGLGVSFHRFDSNAACLSCLYQPTEPAKSQTELVADALGLPHERVIALWVTEQPPTATELATIARHLGVSIEVIQEWEQRRLQDLYTQVVCGAIGLDLAGVGRLEAVPLAHQSTLAGVLMAAELVKRSDKDLAELSQREALVTWEDVRRKAPRMWAVPRAREPNCICGDSVYQDVYRSKWRSPT